MRKNWQSLFSAKGIVLAALTFIALLIINPADISADAFVNDDTGRIIYICDDGIFHYKGNWSSASGNNWLHGEGGNQATGVYLENGTTNDLLYMGLPAEAAEVLAGIAKDSTDTVVAVSKPDKGDAEPRSVTINTGRIYYFGKVEQLTGQSDEAPAETGEATAEPGQPAANNNTQPDQTQPAQTQPNQTQPETTQPPKNRQAPAPTSPPAPTAAPPAPTTQAPATTAPPAPTTQAPASGSYDRGSAEQLIWLINDYRAANGVGTLSMSENLMSVAASRAKEISSDFSHSGISKYGNYGENIFMGAGDSKYAAASTALQAFKNSASHNTNQLYSAYRYIGVGHYITPNGAHYWAVVFSF